MTELSPVLQVLKKQGPALPHWALEVHDAGTPFCVSGKYCSPMPMPADAGSFMKAVMADDTAFHLDFCAATRSFMEPEMSIMKYRSSGSSWASTWVAAQPAKASAGMTLPSFVGANMPVGPSPVT